MKVLVALLAVAIFLPFSIIGFLFAIARDFFAAGVEWADDMAEWMRKK